MTQLKQECITEIRKNKALKKALIDFFCISEKTFYNYLRNNSPQLSNWGALQIIAAYLRQEPEGLIIEMQKI